MVNSRPSVTRGVGDDNAVTIPKRFPDKHDIGPGDDVKIELIEDPVADGMSEEEVEELKELIEELY